MDSYQWYLVAVFAVVIASLLWAGKTYNRLIRLRNRAEAMWAEIDVQLKRRHDLVPNLVHVVEGYATHERGTLDEVTRARSQATTSTTSNLGLRCRARFGWSDTAGPMSIAAQMISS